LVPGGRLNSSHPMWRFDFQFLLGRFLNFSPAKPVGRGARREFQHWGNVLSVSFATNHPTAAIKNLENTKWIDHWSSRLVQPVWQIEKIEANQYAETSKTSSIGCTHLGGHLVPNLILSNSSFSCVWTAVWTYLIFFYGPLVVPNLICRTLYFRDHESAIRIEFWAILVEICPKPTYGRLGM
jgi:hypothetical protein